MILAKKLEHYRVQIFFMEYKQWIMKLYGFGILKLEIINSLL